MTQKQDQKHLETTETPETEAIQESHEETHIPEIAQKKVSKFGPGAFQNGSKFGKGAMNFNPPNKQRPGRAAGRGR